jgi:magnesium chelatase subunit I
VHRDDRFGEKLATPDTSIADLIGEVDPIKVAEGRYLSDELTLHYGLVPRTNRGIFAINEIPDLAERIQVGLLNVLEERDVQIRGYKIRLPLDVLLVASANPEDYTNRGRIITPLKDRFGSQIRTHYPLDAETEVRSCARRRGRPRWATCTSRCPTTSSAWSPRSASWRAAATRSTSAAVSACASRSATSRCSAPTRCAAGCVRASAGRAARVRPRRARRSTSGKVEIESLEEGRDGVILENLVKACRAHRVQGARHARSGARGRRRVRGGRRRPHRRGHRLGRRGALVRAGPGAARRRASLTGGDESPAAVAAAVEFVLEGLHLSKRLNKDAVAEAVRAQRHLPRPR